MKESLKIAISGVKNSGKTTLIEKLIPELHKKGLKTAVIKHDGHDFEPDVPGTDSYRIRNAGAYGTAVFSASRYLLVKDTEGSAIKEENTESGLDPAANRKEISISEKKAIKQENQDRMAEELALSFPEADLILLEGFKNSKFPKLEIVRKGNSEKSVCEGKNLLALLSDFELAHPKDMPLLDLNDPKGIADFLVTYLKMQQEQQMDQQMNQTMNQQMDQQEDDKKVSCKIMLSEDDYYFGPGVFHLLQKIEETGSIRSAAAEIGLSYTKACKMLKRAEMGSGIHFLVKTIGGRNGGKSVLTPEGRNYMDKYQQLLQESQKAVQQLYRNIFRGIEG